MNQVDSGVVYRICASSEERWQVLRDSSPEPVATFNDKHAALAHAMSLARERSGWQLPFAPHQDALRSIFNQSRIHE